MKTSSKIAAVAATAALATTGIFIAGCNSAPTTSSKSSSEGAVSKIQNDVSDKVNEVKSDSKEDVVWDKDAAKKKIEISAEDKARFEKAVKDNAKAAAYQPDSVIATQLVAGLNYAYLAETADGAHAIIVVYEDLSGNASVTGIKPIDPNDIKTTNVAAGELIGSWMPDPDAAGCADEADVELFRTAVEAKFDLTLRPIEVLSKAEGQPTRFLAIGTTLPAQKSPSLFVVDIDSADTVSDVKIFELTSYVSDVDGGTIQETAEALRDAGTTLMNNVVNETQELVENVSNANANANANQTASSASSASSASASK